jgi:hypothetical protein
MGQGQRRPFRAERVGGHADGDTYIEDLTLFHLWQSLLCYKLDLHLSDVHGRAMDSHCQPKGQQPELYNTPKY